MIVKLNIASFIFIDALENTTYRNEKKNQCQF